MFHELIGRKIRKPFGDKMYLGVIDGYDPSKGKLGWWHVTYEVTWARCSKLPSFAPLHPDAVYAVLTTKLTGRLTGDPQDDDREELGPIQIKKYLVPLDEGDECKGAQKKRLSASGEIHAASTKEASATTMAAAVASASVAVVAARAVTRAAV